MHYKECIHVEESVFHAMYAEKQTQVLGHNHQQKLALEKSFAVHFIPNKTAVKKLALQTGLTERQVGRWFSFKRYKIRRGRCEQTVYASESLY